MCYQLILSTDAAEDLAAHNDDLVSFSRELPGLPEERLLEHTRRWFVGSRHGCSCGFRHLHVSSVELGFGEPVDWYHEEAEDVAATLRFIAIVRALVASGARVDCIDAWNHGEDPVALAGIVAVDLAIVSDRAFRFMENHRFVFVLPSAAAAQ
jgi:hypothetical protein